jgi:glutaminase
LNDVYDAARTPEGATAVLLTPIEEFLSELHTRISKESGGRVADYIPELGKADQHLRHCTRDG